jgi:hypothetical protein
MRNPARMSALFLAMALLGGLLLWFGARRHGVAGEDWTAIVPVGLGALAIFFGAIGAIRALVAARGHAKLMSGTDIIARWHVGPADWGRFRAADTARAASGRYWLANPWLRQETPPGGVDIIVGKDAIIVDGCYQGLRADARGVSWLAPAGDPLSYLEFRFASRPQTSLGGVALRVPVPPAAQGEARRVHDWFQPRLRPAPALAFRDPRRTYRVSLAAAALCLALGGAGWMMASANGYRVDEEDFLSILPFILLAFGVIGGVAGAILALATFLLTLGTNKARR